MKLKHMKKVPKIIGNISAILHRDTIYQIGIVTNAQSDAINYLYEVVCEQNKEIESLKETIEKMKEDINLALL